MDGQTVLVTGATDGIGRQTALELARRGARVIVHGRSLEKAAQAQAALSQEVPGGLFETAAADLGDLAQVRSLAQSIQARYERLDVLIHNAAVVSTERQFSADGYELTLAVNHLAPFVLTLALLPLLRASRSRVITVSSTAHNRGQLDFADLQLDQQYNVIAAYDRSKLANVLFANALAERERGSLTSNSLHPGVVSTKLLMQGFHMTGISTVEGAATSVYLASSPEVANTTGRYFIDCREAPADPRTLDPDLQKRLWEVSAQMAGIS